MLLLLPHQPMPARAAVGAACGFGRLRFVLTAELDERLPEGEARRRHVRGEPSNWPSDMAGWADECLIFVIILIFLGLACCTTLIPTQFDRGLDSVGRWVAHKHPDLEKLVTIDPGVYAGIWLTGGAMALVGLAAVTAVYDFLDDWAEVQRSVAWRPASPEPGGMP